LLLGIVTDGTSDFPDSYEKRFEAIWMNRDIILYDVYYVKLNMDEENGK